MPGAKVERHYFDMPLLVKAEVVKGLRFMQDHKFLTWQKPLCM